MPKTKLQRIIFTIMMVFVMVYAMVCYNIAISFNGMQNKIFLIALEELIIMVPVAFLLEMFVVEKLALFLAFRVVRPEDHPFLIQLMISAMIVCLMCPSMSFVATLLYRAEGTQILSGWIQTTLFNFPMALCWQIFIAGPFVRLLFRTIFKKQLSQ